MQPRTSWQTIPIGVVLLLVSYGCSRPQEKGGAYLVFGGTVRGVSPETGKLHVVISEPRGSDWMGRTMECVLTSDSELYLNDRFATLSEIQERDSVQVIGYFDRDEREQFWVTQAEVSRPVPPPPVPVLGAPASQPSSAPVQEQTGVNQPADSVRPGL